MSLPSSKHLVVFGAGYVGGEVARQAIARGFRVTALTRNHTTARALAEAGVTVIVDDLAADTWHTHAALRDGADCVLNCVSSGGGGPEGYRRSYVDGMKSVLAWASGVTAGTIVYTGSTSVYPQDGGVRVTEEDSIEEVRTVGNPLVEAEDLLLASGAGARRFVLRLAGIYGPGRHYLVDQLREGRGEVAGLGGHRLNLIHRDDIAGAIWAAFTAPASVDGGVFNVADDGAAPKAEVAEFLATKLGLPAPRFTGEPAQGRRRVTPDRVIANDKIKRVLGWQPVYPSYREGYAAILGA
ncbi:NAD-dependent epimerase/dehydratase family protein [Rariglobus hedericola]|uniref:NAD-dependent epimerase/dehydratase family protein n=1 Tax=Rariglobus hedericola TaxID=2597822 RepID=A0A556QMT1_9BACT|nr:NAD-dependent epimerase/dehydratase family protein [Rariglobus hedericola]TSJ77948.1 NAD-dependent epimerase/dehydratase family protein [Rariglobus hedericola]